MKAIYSTSKLNGEGFIFNTTTGEWDMCANVSTSHPRYQADASDMGRAKQAAEGTFLVDVELVDDGVNEEASA